MTSAYKIESNRRNAQKSTGPKTAAGKKRARNNALKHGLCAQSPVLPDEDPEAFTHHLDGCIASFQPRDEVERNLAETFALAVWKRRRCLRAETGLTARYMQKGELEEESRQRLEVQILGSRLFWDRRGDSRFYPHDSEPREIAVPTSASPSESFDVAGDPAVILIKLESTLAGCRFLLDRWAELKDLLQPGQCWHSPDKLRATRLLGKQPLDALDARKVGQVFVASHAINPEHPGPFYELELEFPPESDQRRRFLEWLNQRYPEADRPKNDAEARRMLEELAETETARLEELAAAHEERAELYAETAALSLAFDPGDVAERVRRHERACVRDMFAALKELKENRRALAAEAGPGRYLSDTSPGTVWNPPVDRPWRAGADSARPLAPDFGSPEPEDGENAAPNDGAELSGPPDHETEQPAVPEQKLQNEPNAACSDCAESSSPADHQTGSPAVLEQKLQNEPNADRNGDAESAGRSGGDTAPHEPIGGLQGHVMCMPLTEPASRAQCLDELSRVAAENRRARTRRRRRAELKKARKHEEMRRRDRVGRDSQKADLAPPRILAAVM